VNLSVIEPAAFRIEETLIVIEPAAGVRIKGSRIAIELVVEFKIEESWIMIQPGVGGRRGQGAFEERKDDRRGDSGGRHRR
jgi:hypothetical protein